MEVLEIGEQQQGRRAKEVVRSDNQLQVWSRGGVDW